MPLVVQQLLTIGKVDIATDCCNEIGLVQQKHIH